MLAVVPARAGSRRLPGKNFTPFSGLSLTVRAARQALALPFVSRVVVSSDAPPPPDLPPGVQFHVRPLELAQDHTSSQALARHLWARYGHGRRGLLWLQPTSPLRTHEDILAAHALWAGKTRVVSASPGAGKVERHVRRGFFLAPDVTPEPGDTLVHLNGAVYILDPPSVGLEDWVSGARVHLMPPERSVDIDTQEDWDEAIRLVEGQA